MNGNKICRDGWHRVYDLKVLIEDGEIVHILGKGREGYDVRMYPYVRYDSHSYTSISLKGTSLDAFRKMVKRGTVRLMS